jgi:hypothetical protein
MHLGLTLIVLLIVAFLYLDSLVARAIEYGGTSTLGVETSVGDVDLRVLRGSVGVSDLRIANPEGFKEKTFLNLGNLAAEVAPASLREDLIVIPRVLLEDVEVSIEGGPGRTNYGTLIRNASGDTAKKPDESGSGKRFVIRELVVRNVTAKIGLTGLGTNLASTEFTLPEIRLENLGEKSGGVQMGEMIARITRAIVSAVSRQTPTLASALESDLRIGVQATRGQVDQIREEAESAVDQLRGIFRKKD